MASEDNDGFGSEEALSSHSYFIPMVDMLAGIVFILVILLASMTLVTRDEFDQGMQAQAEAARIETELAALQDMERTILQPRRDADTARRRLIEILAERLESLGYAVQTRPDSGEMSLTIGERFTNSAAGLNAEGSKLSLDLAEALYSELPCLAQAGTGTSSVCDAYPPARLDAIQLIYRSTEASATDSTLAEARALILLSQTVASAPNLLSLRAVDGTPILSSRAQAHAPAAVTTSDGVEESEGLQSIDMLDITVQMNVPPLQP